MTEWLRALATQPERVGEIQQRYYREHLALWSRALEGQSPGAVAPDADRRFASTEWTALPFFRLVKESYLLNARWLQELAQLAQLAPREARRLDFVLRQYLDALAPTNFPATNPEVLRLAAQTQGASLVAGLRNLQADAARGRIRMTNTRAFEVGRNLAVTPGAVVFENPIAQLIQYLPRTPKVHSRPLLIIPPFINKYYILDLQPQNSFVRFALDEGFQVFIVSWRNAGEELRGAGWDDYAARGVLEPLGAVLQIGGVHRANLLGFCVGGTLLASALAVMPRAERVASLTLLATMLDFSDVGEIGVYIDEGFVADCENRYRDGGLVPGRRLADAFASLRANELVWHFHVNNYLMGRTPGAFDLLFWNDDSANVPGPLYAWYLRNAYLENNLRVPGRVKVLGEPLDLRRIRAPCYLLATREDHIVPWTSAYEGTRLLGGRIDFTLGASGHVAGVINPPAAGRRCYWRGALDANGSDGWLAAAQREPGSWWPHWSAWLRSHAGKRVNASANLGSSRYPVIEAAPGRYVRERADSDGAGSHPPTTTQPGNESDRRRK